MNANFSTSSTDNIANSIQSVFSKVLCHFNLYRQTKWSKVIVVLAYKYEAFLHGTADAAATVQVISHDAEKWPVEQGAQVR